MKMKWEQCDFCEICGEYAESSLITVQQQAVGGGKYIAFDSFYCSCQSSTCPSWRECPHVISVMREYDP